MNVTLYCLLITRHCAKSGTIWQVMLYYKMFPTVAPRWVQEPEDINITRGREAQFDCAGYGIPEPKISWQKATGWFLKPLLLLYLAMNIMVGFSATSCCFYKCA